VGSEANTVCVMRRALCALSVGISSVLAAVGGSAAVEAEPPGFTNTVVATGSSTLTAIAGLPDGRVIALEKSGRLVRIDDRDGSAEQATMAKFDVCTDSERGLLGFALDPGFVTSGFVYIYRTIASGEPGGCHNRVSRFLMDSNGLDLASEQVLVDRISSVAGNHNGGDIEIGNDGYLYIAVGDAGRDPRGDSGSAGSNDAAQDLSLLNGKILRVDRATGFAAPGNPFMGGDSADCRERGNSSATPRTVCREIFAYGLRNPYRFAFDPNTSATRFYINDVGQGTREEVNDGANGANYGWPIREGRCPQGSNPPCAGPTGGLADPVTDYSHEAGLFVTGGAFVPNGYWPVEYDGAYLVSDGAFGTTWAFRGEPNLADAEVFLDASRPTDMAFVAGPTGPALWYVQQNGEVHKVTYAVVAAPADSGPLRYESLPTIKRVFDTREIPPLGPVRAGQTRLIDLGAPAGAKAALVNITMVRPRSVGAFVTAWQPRTPRPATATANADISDVVANASIVPLDADGRVLVFAQATTDLIIDVSGFYLTASDAVGAGRLVTANPERVADTREPVTPVNSYVRAASGAGDVVTIPLAGKAGLPANAGDIDAVVLVVTGVQSDGPGPGFLTAYPTGVARPLASNANVNVGTDVRANLAVVAVSDSGSVDLYLERVRNVAVDVAGYITSDTAGAATQGRFHLVVPTREVDTRVGGQTSFAAGETRNLNATSVPDGASALAQNLTMIRTGGRGFVTARPVGSTSGVSSVNAADAGLTRGALGVVALASGSESFTASVSTHLTVDVFGWYE
jgi:glucose/arabinose dehydrogenase